MTPPAKRTLDLVIFDCDGVLIDSEPISNRVFAEVLTESGLATSAEESRRLYLGRSLPDALEIAEQRLGRALPADLPAEYRRRLIAEFERGLRPVEGVEAAIARVSASTCVASSGSRARIEKSLAIAGLLEAFRGRIFSAEDVRRGKPAPDLFLHAAAAMGASPGRTAVVEDSPAGVQAASSAGMIVFGFAAGEEAVTLEELGAEVFADMSDLPAMLERAGGRTS